MFTNFKKELIKMFAYTESYSVKHNLLMAFQAPCSKGERGAVVNCFKEIKFWDCIIPIFFELFFENNVLFRY